MTLHDAGALSGYAERGAVDGRVGRQTWDDAVALPAFQRLVRLKRMVIVPMVAVYMVYFFGVMLLMGFARPLMAQPLVGSLTIGYALIIGIYLLCWAMALLYVAVATFWFDPQVAKAVAERDRTGAAS